MKMKTKPTERIKRRYLLIEAENREVVERALLDYIGLLGWAKASPVNVSSSLGIVLSIDRAWLTHARAAFAISPEKIKVRKVSGTLAGLRR